MCRVYTVHSIHPYMNEWFVIAELFFINLANDFFFSQYFLFLHAYCVFVLFSTQEQGHNFEQLIITEVVVRYAENQHRNIVCHSSHLDMSCAILRGGPYFIHNVKPKHIISVLFLNFLHYFEISNDD